MLRYILRSCYRPTHNYFRNLHSNEITSTNIADWPGKYQLAIKYLFDMIGTEKAYEDIVKKEFLDLNTWSQHLSLSRRKLVKNPLEILEDEDSFNKFRKLLDDNFDVNGLPFIKRSSLEKSHSVNECKNFLFRRLLKNAEVSNKDTMDAYKSLISLSDLRNPSEWYPYARLLKRKIIYHGGPTNSGKV
jgi:hypothetical protein